MDGFVDLVDDLLRVSDDKKEVDDADFAVNARDPKTGRALLHEACARGDMGIVKLLLMKTEADLMLRTMLGRCTPLHLAVSNNHRPIVFLLLSHGADALSRDRFGCSPLHYVKSPSVAKLLVQYGGKALDYNTVRSLKFRVP
ncbi:uncharacterized protein PITG_13894 [Phytophthora infestans T30-4]|uniref:Uncharacterized protein n=1 Tax=Phytophthora infestans (strain T30-4) TaxID=403677 RepID=D0NN14_PHYIT|nr:uncharacterized protein PITG_13894 [Phytophthora infestans T30-4]EEY61921.1 conserved hypothetical protein [Phytophthora infestans T30-4]|eukprot:XP_002899561.1 conserved hypothetical protein [Phytophthora infestans T30-4]